MDILTCCKFMAKVSGLHPPTSTVAFKVVKAPKTWADRASTGAIQPLAWLKNCIIAIC